MVFPIKTGKEIAEGVIGQSLPKFEKGTPKDNECFWPCSDLQKQYQEMDVILLRGLKTGSWMYLCDSVKEVRKRLLLMSKACDSEEKKDVLR